MPFPEAVVKEAFKRSGGRCECTRSHEGDDNAPHFGGRCPRTFSELYGGWVPFHKVSLINGGDNSLENCEIICEACHLHADLL